MKTMKLGGVILTASVLFLQCGTVRAAAHVTDACGVVEKAEAKSADSAAGHAFAGVWITDAEMAAQVPRPVNARQLKSYLLPTNNLSIGNRHVLFRKAFELKSVRNARVFITADDYYKLYVYGVFAGQGPAAGTVGHTPYDTYDVSALLKTGRNVLAVHTYYQGLVNRKWVSGDNRHGLLLDLDVDGRTVVASDASFRQARHRGYQVATGVTPGIPKDSFYQVPSGTVGYDTQYMERYDAGAPEVGFERPDFDDSAWPSAVPHPRGGDYRLVPSPVPTVVTEEIRPVSCVQVPTTSAPWVTLRLDFGAVYVGSLAFAASGAKGTEIGIRCGQELNADGSVRHKMRCNCDYTEQFVLSGGSRDVLEQYDYKSFRYVELSIPTGAGKIDTQSIVLKARHRPFALKAKPNLGGDSELAKIWQVAVDSFRWGVQEQIMDCMEREKGYYLGDGIYTMYSYCLLTDDWQPARTFIDDFLRTRDIDPGLMTCANCSFMQEIAEYSLMLVLFADMYLDATGDAAFFKASRGDGRPRPSRGTRSDELGDILDTYRTRYARADGLLTNLDKWCLVEWPKNFQDGYDAEIREWVVSRDVHNVMNAWYVGAVKSLNKLAAAVGRASYADAAKLEKAFTDAFWDPVRKVFVDRVGSRHVSMPGNTYAAFFDLAPAADRAAFKTNVVAMAKAKFPDAVSFFQFPPLFFYLEREGEGALVRELILHPGAWRRALREGATRSIEGWGYDTKWNTSLFHLTMGSVVMFLTDRPRSR